MSGSRTVPAPGQAALPAASVGALLARNADRFGDRPFVRFGDHVTTHAEYVDECRRWASVLADRRPDPARAFHVGVLLENTPTYLAVLGGAALCGATVVGLNDTRRGEQLVRDARHGDVAIIVTEPETAAIAAPVVAAMSLDDDHHLTSTRWSGPDATAAGREVEPLLAAAPRFDLASPGPTAPRDVADEAAAPTDAAADDPADDPATPYRGGDVDVSTTWCLIFTSGTTADPKAVVCSQRRMLTTGERMRILLEVTPEDVGYIAMPLFHSNALMVGFMPALVAGASVGLARRFTASGFIDDVRRYGATWFNYTGKPLSYILATPARPDDRDNSLRRAFGNEGSPDAVARFAERFGCEVIDLFGPTEGAIGIVKDDDTPATALGRAGDTIQVVGEDGVAKPTATFDATGRLINAGDCVGEIVNTAGGGPFEGYYGDDEATARATRFGWYWTGDLGYRDADGYLYFAGRADDWVRVDGENFPTGPIELALARHPGVVVAAAYGVPDEAAGDQVMVAVEWRDDIAFDPAALAAWLDAQPDLPPKWRPRYLRIADDLPRTATNKIVTRVLKQQKFRRDLIGADEVWVRDRGATTYRPFEATDEDAARAALTANGRDRFWDL